MSDSLTRRIQIIPAYDNRDLDPKKNYGVHGMELYFILQGPKGAITWTFCTGMQLPHVAEEMRAKDYPQKPYGGGISYHSRQPHHEGQEAGSCTILPEKKCYCDSSYLDGNNLGDKFIVEGEDVVWAKLQEWYNDLPEKAE